MLLGFQKCTECNERCGYVVNHRVHNQKQHVVRRAIVLLDIQYTWHFFGRLTVVSAHEKAIITGTQHWVVHTMAALSQ